VSEPARFVTRLRTVNEPLGAVVTADPDRTGTVLSLSATLQRWPTRLLSTSSSTRIRRSSCLALSVHVAPAEQVPDVRPQRPLAEAAGARVKAPDARAAATRAMADVAVRVRRVLMRDLLVGARPGWSAAGQRVLWVHRASSGRAGTIGLWS